jgi:hypothetical protein
LPKRTQFLALKSAVDGVKYFDGTGVPLRARPGRRGDG